jgi:hypothetical protein
MHVDRAEQSKIPSGGAATHTIVEIGLWTLLDMLLISALYARPYKGKEDMGLMFWRAVKTFAYGG